MAKNLFFISDTHFSHHNIITFCNRPFKSAEEMDEFMINAWNKRVKSGDSVYHLGDVTMKRPKYVASVLDQLNGHLRLVRGNHDIYHTKEYLPWFEEIYGVRVIDNILFSHIPVHPMSMGRFMANVHGHIHNNPNFDPVMRIEKKSQAVKWVPYINISVEAIDYTPISLEELKKRILVETIVNSDKGGRDEYV